MDLNLTAPLPATEYLDETLDLKQRLKAAGGNISHLARELGVGHLPLYKRLRQNEA